MLNAIQSILIDRQSGASTLLARFTSELDNIDEKELHQALTALQITFPAMAVWTFAAAFFQEQNFDRKSIEVFRAQILEANDGLLKRAESVLADYATFLTLSRSTLVESYLKQRAINDEIKTVCAVSLPGEEGTHLQAELSKNGMEAECVQDWELESALEPVDAVIMGADWLTDEMIINKWGSAMLVKQAERLNKPVYILAESFKHTSNRTFREEHFYQDWSDGFSRRKIKVLETIPRKSGIIVI